MNPYSFVLLIYGLDSAWWNSYRVFVCNDLVPEIESTGGISSRKGLNTKNSLSQNQWKATRKGNHERGFPLDRWFPGLTTMAEIHRAESCCCFWHCHKSLRTTKLVTRHAEMTTCDLSCQLPIRSSERWLLPHFCFLNHVQMHLTGWS